MSTIASPRDRRPPSNLPSPSPSARPSTDSLQPPVLSPQPPQTPPPPKRNNRAALREYYNIRRPAPQDAHEDLRSEVATTEIDAEGFDADAWVERKLDESGLEDLLKLYTTVLGEIRALDAEKKALVYDNYSKLITATDTIKKVRAPVAPLAPLHAPGAPWEERTLTEQMRANMDPLDPITTDLDPKIAQIYAQASQVRDALRERVPKPEETPEQWRTRELAREVLAMPDKLRALVEEGRHEEAQRAWEMPRRLLVVWQERGLGGEDVARILEDGDGILDSGSGSGGGGESGGESGSGSGRTSES